MEYQRLGQTELEISRIGFGCYPMGGWDWGEVSDKKSIAAVHKALELGINFFDTADIYGLGHSEKILSKALGAYKKKVIVATKGGLKWDNKKKISHCDLSQNHLIKTVNNSLRRLKIDCIPIYQIHYADQKTPISETMQALKKLQKEGKIKYLGLTNISSLELIDEFQKHARLESLQLPYNIINQKFSRIISSMPKKWKMSILSYGSLLQGLLSGKYGGNIKFDKDDHRYRDKNFQGERLKANLIVVDKLKKLTKKYNKTFAQIAINWIIDNPQITSALVGIKTPEQIEENAKAVGWRLSAEDYEMIGKSGIKIYKKYNLKLPYLKHL